MPSYRITRFGAFASIGATLAVIGLVVLPFHLDGYQLHWAITVLMYVVIALAWDVLARTGQSSFGQVGFFGLGAYGSGLLSTALNMNAVWSIFLSALGVAAVAALCGSLFLRVRGIYFAILTLALAEVFKVLATELSDVTGGPMGLTVPPIFGGDAVKGYLFLLALSAACVIGARILERSKLDFAITAIRSSPEVASAFGVPVKTIRLGIFSLSAMITAVMGGFYAFYTSYINPESVFDTGISVAPVIMCIFGGLYTIAGPIIGAVILTLLQEYLRTMIESGSLVIYGVLLIISIIFMPQGVWGLLSKGWSKFRAPKAASVKPIEPIHAADQ